MSKILSTLHLLYVGHESASETRPGWLAQAFREMGKIQLSVCEVTGLTEGMRVLQNETFDAVLVSHALPQQDAMAFVSACRTAGRWLPILVLGNVPSARCFSKFLEAGADDYVSLHDTTAGDLLWKISRAVEFFRNQQIVREARRERRPAVVPPW